MFADDTTLYESSDDLELLIQSYKKKARALYRLVKIQQTRHKLVQDIFYVRNQQTHKKRSQ